MFWTFPVVSPRELFPLPRLQRVGQRRTSHCRNRNKAWEQWKTERCGAMAREVSPAESLEAALLEGRHTPCREEKVGRPRVPGSWLFWKLHVQLLPFENHSLKWSASCLSFLHLYWLPSRPQIARSTYPPSPSTSQSASFWPPTGRKLRIVRGFQKRE